jgi:hypothetical protein
VTLPCLDLEIHYLDQLQLLIPHLGTGLELRGCPAAQRAAVCVSSQIWWHALYSQSPEVSRLDS